MGFAVPPQDIDDVVNARKGAVEHVLLFIRQKASSNANPRVIG